MKVTLYKKDVTDAIREWSIERIDDITVRIRHGLLEGLKQEKDFNVFGGKAGRTLNEQVSLEMASRIHKQRDAGYTNSIREARENPITNSINMPKPMLASKYKSINHLNYLYIQRKYDGNRCLIANVDGAIFAYSRNGKIIKSIDHILNAAEIPEGAILDGELYHHGTSLQRIRSWIARDQPESKNLVYMCYDIINNMGFEDRLEYLKLLTLPEPILIAETSLIREPSGLEIETRIREYTKKARADGYEGAILRCPHTEYETGKRSKSLIKVKEWLDAEFPVIDIKPSADGWAILICRTHDYKLFSASAPGSINEKKEVLQNKEKYIGRNVTIEYSGLTNENKPFHPIAIAFRDSHD